MKKIILSFALSFAALSFGQNYPNNNNNGWGNDNSYGNNSGYYGDEDDERYFPDDYYYNYPNDYYANDYYQGNYNDYRNSIISINWNNFFVANRLAQWQIREILYLNSLYSSFSSWNNFYRYNPDRWYYDRFYALNRILGPQVFVVFQNNFYNGYSPIIHFQNHRRTFYSAPRFAVMPRYRNININIYKVDRKGFRNNNNPYWKVAQRSKERNRGEFRNNNSIARNNSETRANNGFRGNDGRNTTIRSNDSKGIRSNDSKGIRNNDSKGNRNNGFGNQNTRSESRPVTPKSNDVRSNSSFGDRNNGMRTQTSRNESRSSSSQRRSESPRSIRSNESRNNGGQRMERSNNNNHRKNNSSSTRSTGRFTRN